MKALMIALGVYLLLRRARAQGIASATQSLPPGATPTAPPPGMTWVRLMNGGYILMRENDPLRFAID